MTRLRSQDVETYFTQYGWVIHADGINRWITGWQGDRHAFPLLVTYTETCLDMIVTPLIDLTVDWQSWPEFLQLFAEINDEARLVKLTINSEKYLTLSLQLLNSNLDFETFSDAVGILGYYAEQLHDLLVKEVMRYGLHLQSASRLLT